jgi:hypothetical protein
MANDVEGTLPLTAFVGDPRQFDAKPRATGLDAQDRGGKCFRDYHRVV